MRIETIFEYLIGRRKAIGDIAADRRAPWVGALLVVSAALARNYDRVSLLHEPWRLLGPFVASLAISGALFLTIYGLACWKGMQSPRIGRAYRAFLALYWMTAPLAWLYAIPYERFLDPLGAVRANLWTLALVSLWRVALMIRVVGVVFNLPVFMALPLVLLVADASALVALHLVPLPVIHVMGGISPEQDAIALTVFLVKGLCWLTLPFWIVPSVAAIFSRKRPEWRVPPAPAEAGSSLRALAFAGATVFGWAALLPLTQPEQLLAHLVDRAYRTGGPAAALEVISAHELGDFPPGWQPPPRRFPGEPPIDEMLDMLSAVASKPRAGWVRDLYARRFVDRVHYESDEWREELLTQHAVQLASILTRLPQGPAMVRAFDYPGPSVDWLLKSDASYQKQALTGEQRDALRKLLELSGETTSPAKNAPDPKKGMGSINLDGQRFSS